MTQTLDGLVIAAFGRHMLVRSADGAQLKARRFGRGGAAVCGDQVRCRIDARHDEVHVLDVLRLIIQTPSLLERAHAMALIAESALAHELAELSADHDPVLAAVAAAQLAGTRRCLAAENQRRLLGGESCAQVYPDAVASAVRAFALVENGLGTWPD